MTREDWTQLRRLLAAWPRRAGSVIDDAVYCHVLERFEAVQVHDALVSLAGLTEHLPTAAEVARRVVALFPGTGVVDRELVARRLEWLERADREECERRDRELEVWAAAHPREVAAGEAFARRIGLSTGKEAKSA